MDTVRALIVGTGGLGGETGRRLSALGAHVTGVRRRVELGAPPGFDRVIPLSAGLDLFSRLPRAEMHVFGRCGHWTQIEHAARFNELVLGFLGGVEG